MAALPFCHWSTSGWSHPGRSPIPSIHAPSASISRSDASNVGSRKRQTAAQLGVNTWTIVNWETGRYEPPIRSMPAILDFLGYHLFAAPTTVGERLLRAGLVNQTGGPPSRGWPEHLARLGSRRADPLPHPPHQSCYALGSRPTRTGRRNGGSLERKASALGTLQNLARNEHIQTPDRSTYPGFRQPENM